MVKTCEVYDTLGTFTGHPPAFRAGRVGDNHHHLICRTCGRMVDVDCAVGYTPCLTAADDSGYEIDEAEVIYWGRCPECVAALLSRRRLKADTQRDTSRATQPWIQSNQGPRATSHQKETASKEKDRRV